MEILANKETFRQYLFFWVGQLFSLLGSMVVFFVLMYWIAFVYNNPMISAFSTFLYVIVMTITMPLAGVVADRVNRKLLIIVADSSQAFFTFALILFFQFGVANIWIVYIFLSLRSVCQAFHAPTVNAIIPTMVPKDKLSRINGVNFLFNGVVQMIAPFIGATLLIFLSVNMIFWADVITYFIALVPLLIISIPSVNQINHSEEKIEKRSFIKEFRLGFKTIRLIPGVITLLILAMILNFLIRPLDSLMALFIINFHGGAAGHLALTQMTFTGGLISGALLTSIKKNWNNKIRTIFIALGIAMLGYLIFALAPPGQYYIIALGGIILGFNLPIVNSLAQTYMQMAVPPDKLGRVGSIDHALSSAISPIGAILSGPLALIFGIQGLFILFSVIGIASTIGFWSFTGIRKVDLDSESTLKEINGKIENISI